VSLSVGSASVDRTNSTCSPAVTASRREWTTSGRRSDALPWVGYTRRHANSLNVNVRAPSASGVVAIREESAVGDPTAAFEEFFATERTRLHRALFAITGSRTEAEDIAQDAFLRVWERWARVGSLDDPAGYLHRTAMNVFRDRRRRLVNSLRRVIQPPTAPNEYDLVEARSIAVEMLGSLSPRQRAAIVLTEGLGYSAEEAGRMLGIKGSTVRALHYQARSSMRRAQEGIDG
jgi:RNA polymerase sigma factor (sigma-70 family)